jgi:DNA polymerase III delta prime subunit
LQITEDRRSRVIYLYFNQHKTYAEIAKIEKMSIRDISAIIKVEKARRQRYEQQQQQEELSAKAYELFSKGKTSIEVAVALNLREPEVTKLYIEYWKLKRLDILSIIHKETNGNLGTFLKLYRQLIKEKGMSIEQVVNAVDIDINRLPYMESLYGQVKEHVDKMQCTRQQLENYLHVLNDDEIASKGFTKLVYYPF